MGCRLLAAAMVLISGVSTACGVQRTFEIKDDLFVKDGIRHQIISGSVHYFRIHPDYWLDRLTRVKAMGLNAIEVYVPWNLHEPRPGKHEWGGRDPFANVTRFLDLAHALHLDVLLRPGPYICAEWDFGGLPWWLASAQVRGGGTMQLRNNDPDYLLHVDAWWCVLLARLAPYLYERGGPIVMVQIENEYGFCGDNKEYLRHLAATARAALGNSTILYTTDPPGVAAKGTLPGDEVYTVVDFGPATNLDWAFGVQKSFNPPGRSPPLCSEFYTGWLTHWGERMANTSADIMARSFRDILAYANGTGSVSLYMAHGGTNFGFWAGAMSTPQYSACITSYDYDCPVSEAGGYGQPGIGGTSKYELIRSAVAEHTGQQLPAVPPAATPRAYGCVALTQQASLMGALRVLSPGDGVQSPRPQIMEDYGIGSGFILYRTRIPAGMLNGPAVLDVGQPVHDFAQVLLDGLAVGSLERNHPTNVSLPAAVSAGTGVGAAVLDILVHAVGRSNFGCEWDPKGLLGGNVRLNGKPGAAYVERVRLWLAGLAVGSAKLRWLSSTHAGMHPIWAVATCSPC